MRWCKLYALANFFAPLCGAALAARIAWESLPLAMKIGEAGWFHFYAIAVCFTCSLVALSVIHMGGILRLRLIPGWHKILRLFLPMIVIVASVLLFIHSRYVGIVFDFPWALSPLVPVDFILWLLGLWRPAP
jgi:hypothetical protein